MFYNFNGSKLFYNFINKQKTKTVVLLHGWGGNHLSLSPLAGAFNEYNILSVDFFGFGQSDKPSRDFDIYSYSGAVKGLIEFLELQNIILVGHSFGGRVSIILGYEIRELIDTIILIDSAGIKPRTTPRKFVKKINYKFVKFLVKHNLKANKCLSKYGSNDYKQLDDSDKIVFNKIVNEHLEKYLSYIECQTLIIWGDKDCDTPIYMAKKLNKHIKNSKLYVIQNATHFAYLEDTKLVIKIIKEFLK